MINNDNFPKTNVIWLLFDLDNGHQVTKHYVWWFNTRQDARNFLKFHNQQPFAAKLTGPIQYEKQM